MFSHLLQKVLRHPLNWIGRIRGYGGCLRCGDTWNWAEYHTTQYGREGKGCLPLCRRCWRQLTPDQRLPYYYQLIYDVWWTDGGVWEEVSKAVLDGK
jgi:hypothetical protein